MTDSGPPDRITPFGFMVADRLGGLLERHDLGIDPILAHAPGDELGHLGAEIDDEDLVVGLGHGRVLTAFEGRTTIGI